MFMYVVMLFVIVVIGLAIGMVIGKLTLRSYFAPKLKPDAELCVELQELLEFTQLRLEIVRKARREELEEKGLMLSNEEMEEELSKQGLWLQAQIKNLEEYQTQMCERAS